MNTERHEITTVQFTEQELEPPTDYADTLIQVHRLLARLLVQAWLADHPGLTNSIISEKL